MPPVLSDGAEFAKKYPAFTELSIKSLVFKSRDRYSSAGDLIPGNGLAPALIKLGRRVLIDEAKFFEWVEQHRLTATSQATPQGKPRAIRAA